MQIEMLPLHALRPYRRNARTHSKRQKKQIAASIKRFGFTNPILVSDDYEIIAGHGRFEAAKLLGLAGVPVVRLSHLSDPPYNVPIDGHGCGLGRIRHPDFAMGCGEMSEEAFTGFLTTVFRNLAGRQHRNYFAQHP